MMSLLPSFLDFEASSLSSNSYPIEVAWNLPDGTIETHLISPAGIEKWDDWSLLSEKVHGISRDELIAKGKPPVWICDRMNDQLSGKAVYSDNPTYDGFWLAELFSVVSKRRCKFRLRLADEVLFQRVYANPAMRAEAMARKKEVEEEARKRVQGQHRAGWDVQYLVEMYKMTKGCE